MERKGRKKKKWLTAILLAAVLFIASLPSPAAKTVEAAGNVQNPRVTNGITTWDLVYFGNYWQNDTNGDGKADKNDEREPILWRVLSVENGDMLLLSEKVLDWGPFEATAGKASWEQSSIREWLNNEFFMDAFAGSDQVEIRWDMIKNPENPEYHFGGGDDTKDRVFLLSLDEVSSAAYGFFTDYKKESPARRAECTAYARAQGADDNGSGNKGHVQWMLRSPGGNFSHSARVRQSGYISAGSSSADYGVYTKGGIRPAIRIPVGSSRYRYAGMTKSIGGPMVPAEELLLTEKVTVEKGSTGAVQGSYMVAAEGSVNNSELEAKLKEATWTVSDKGIAEVKECKVMNFGQRTSYFYVAFDAKKAGTVTLTGTLPDGQKASCAVTVVDTSGAKVRSPRTVNGVTTWDCVTFGNYWQNDTNGDGTADKNDKKEPIKWRVLSVENGEMLLLADQCLDGQRYHWTRYTYMTWERSDIRTWLNGEFLAAAFSNAEQSAIVTSTVKNDERTPYTEDTFNGNTTEDKVFLLSLNEVRNANYGFRTDYQKQAASRTAFATEYAKTQGIRYDEGNGAAKWMMRTLGYGNSNKLQVSSEGWGDTSGSTVGSYGELDSVSAVRPAIRIPLSSALYTYAGTASSNGGPAFSSMEVALAEKATVEQGSQTAVQGILMAAAESSVSNSSMEEIVGGITWKTGNVGIAEVTGCTVTDYGARTASFYVALAAKKTGTTTLTGTLADGRVVSCTVSVVDTSGARVRGPRTVNGITTWDTVTFGNYWQNDTNGDGTADKDDKKEPILWRVLEVADGEMLLLSEQCLDNREYHHANSFMTWEDSDIRAWLNKEFLETAFSGAEQAAILMSVVKNATVNPHHNDAFNGNDTKDKVFLLSLDEIRNGAYGFLTEYGKPCPARIAFGTAYAVSQELPCNKNNDAGEWMLRTVGSSNSYSARVSSSGIHQTNGETLKVKAGIRPVIRLFLDSALYTPAGTTASSGGPAFTYTEVAIDSTLTAEAGRPAAISGRLTYGAAGGVANSRLKELFEEAVWETSDREIVEVTEGEIVSYAIRSAFFQIILYPKKAGTVTLTGTLPDGMKVSCRVTVADTSGQKIRSPRYEDGITTWDTVTFGSYWQNDTNGDGTANQNDKKEPIPWRVLSVANGEMLLLAEQCLDFQPYHKGNAYLTWERSDIRQWLNGEFFAAAFSTAEQAAIIESVVAGGINAYNETFNGNATKDKVFLLSEREVGNVNYGFLPDTSYADSAARMADGTEYAKALGFTVDKNGSGDWLLRSMGSSNENFMSANYRGSSNGTGLYKKTGIRPVIRLPLSSTLYTYTGTVSREGGPALAVRNPETTPKVTPTPTPDAAVTPVPSAAPTPLPTLEPTPTPGLPVTSVEGPRVVDGVVIWDCVAFGSYWQNDTNRDGRADKGDEKEAIRWRVLAVEDGEAVLLADKILDARAFHGGESPVGESPIGETSMGTTPTGATPMGATPTGAVPAGDVPTGTVSIGTSHMEVSLVTWADSSLHMWLNSDFLNQAFSAAEKEALAAVEVEGGENPRYHTLGGSRVSDKVFLLSVDEARNVSYGFDAEYERASGTRRAESTAYAAAQGAKSINGAGWWWLRTSGRTGSSAANVYNYGDGVYYGNVVTRTVGVRPVIRVSLASGLCLEAGTASAEIETVTETGSIE